MEANTHMHTHEQEWKNGSEHTLARMHTLELDLHTHEQENEHTHAHT